MSVRGVEITGTLQHSWKLEKINTAVYCHAAEHDSCGELNTLCLLRVFHATYLVIADHLYRIYD